MGIVELSRFVDFSGLVDFEKIIDFILPVSTNRQNTGSAAFHNENPSNILLDYFPRLHDIKPI